MKTRYRFIHFERALLTPMDAAEVPWECRNNRSGNVLGTVEYYFSWKQFAFEGCEGCVFSADCLRDIAAFMEQLALEKNQADRATSKVGRKETSGR